MSTKKTFLMTVKRDENGMPHADNEPAARGFDGSQMWYKHGMCHREDGPAVINDDGSIEWWYEHSEYTFDQYAKLVKLSDDQIVELKLEYGY